MDIELPQFGLVTAHSRFIEAAIENMQQRPITTRMVSFILNIFQQNMREALCFELYLRHDELHAVASGRRYLAVLANLLASPDYTHIMFEIFDRLDHEFDTRTEHGIKAEAADIMQRFFPRRSERMFAILRQLPEEQTLPEERILPEEQTLPEERGPDGDHVQENLNPGPEDRNFEQGRQQRMILQPERPMAPPRRDATVYNDRENVHNSTINTSVISACRALMDMMVTTITFDNKFKVLVQHTDTPQTIKNRLAFMMDTDPSLLSIFGNNDKEDHLQPRMTFKQRKHEQGPVIDPSVKAILDRLDRALDGFETVIKRPQSRFLFDEIDDYSLLSGFTDYIFPDEMRCEDPVKQRRREEVFITTNQHLQDVFENECEEEFLFMLDLTNVNDAVMIWIEREQIRKELDIIMNQNVFEYQTLVASVFKDLNLNLAGSSSLKKNIETGTVRDIHLVELLNAVWKFILQQPESVQGEMKQRLREELVDGMIVCTTGIAARLISTIQGFFDEEEHPQLKIKMSINDEIKAKMAKIINDQAIKDDIDPAFDTLLFKTLVVNCIKDSLETITKEYPDDNITFEGLESLMFATYML